MFMVGDIPMKPRITHDAVQVWVTYVIAQIGHMYVHTAFVRGGNLILVSRFKQPFLLIEFGSKIVGLILFPKVN